VPLVIREGRVESEFVLSAGQSALFILEGDEDAPHAIDPHRVSEEFKATLNFWQSWIAQSTYRGRWREIVDRSALVLKLLVSQRHGSIVAAPTFGLPEAIGAGRNWDYRYIWIRDASFTFIRLEPPRISFGIQSIYAMAGGALP
jgi:GH15 family glucan-1,4-alpha-glucosidase